MLIRVRFYNAKTDELEQIREMDYSLASAREWLAKACIWALNHGRAVETINAIDDTLTDEEISMLAEREQELKRRRAERTYEERNNYV